MRRQPILRHSGFTIVELIVVIAIIAILVGIVAFSVNGWRHTTNIAQVKNDLHAAAAAMEAGKNEKTDAAGYPTTIPGSFTAAEKSLIQLYGVPTTEYCIDGTYEGDESIAFYIDSSIYNSGAKEGTCAERETLNVPTIPANFAVATASISSIQATWNTQSNVENFTLQCAADPSFVTNVKTSTVNGVSTSTTVSGLLQGTTYYCRLKATNTKGSSNWTDRKTTNTGIVTPTGFTITALSSTQVSYSFNPVQGASGYEIIYDKGYSGSVLTASVTASSGFISNLTPSTIYFFRVRAITADSQSTYTSSASAGTNNIWSIYTRFTGVGDWDGDGKNDIVAYRPDGSIYLHRGNGALPVVFQSGRYLANIGTDISSLIGIGSLPSSTAMSIWWQRSDGSGRVLTSNGGVGVTGSAITSGGAGTWSGCTSVFSGRAFITGQTAIICKMNALNSWTLNSTAVPTNYTSSGSGWSSSFPAEQTIGVGDWGTGTPGDVVGYTTAGAMTLYAGAGNGATGTTYSLGTGWVSNIVFGGWDYNGDGKTDLLRYITTGASLICFYPGNGVSGFAASYTPCAGDYLVN